MKTVLRDFQEALVEQWVHQGPERSIVAANCGAGKTTIGGALALAVKQKGARSLFCFDLKCLPLQAASDISRLGLTCGIFAAGHPRPQGSEDVILVMLQTLEAELRRYTALGSCPNWDHLVGADIGLLIFDEVHDLVRRKGFEVLRASFPQAQQVGLTATPYRLNPKEYLGRWFDSVLKAPQPYDLIQRGFIVPERVFVPQMLDESQLVEDADGEYSVASQEKQVLKAASLISVVEAWVKICPGIPAACYAASVPHARALCKAFNDYFESQGSLYPGAIAQFQSGETSAAERAAQFQSMREGKTLVICSVGTLTKGFDLDCIGAILFARATKSRALYMQCAGRGCRPLKQPHPAFPHDKQWYYLLVFSQAVDRFGAPSDYQDYDISEQPSRSHGEPLKPCPECGHQCKLSATICDHCGYRFEVSEPDPSTEVETQEIVELYEHFTAANRKLLKKLKRARLEALVSGAPFPDVIEGVGVVPESWYSGLLFGPEPTDHDRNLLREYLVGSGLNATGVAIEMAREFGHA